VEDEMALLARIEKWWRADPKVLKEIPRQFDPA